MSALPVCYKNVVYNYNKQDKRVHDEVSGKTFRNFKTEV